MARRNQSQASAKRRVIMKRQLRKNGVNVNPNLATKKLEKLYKASTGKSPPTLSRLRKEKDKPASEYLK